MARTAGKKQAPAKVEDDDTDGWEDAVVETEAKEGSVDLRLRDWRDVERFREMKELRSLVDDDYGLEEIFRAPLRSRADVPPRQPKATAPAKTAAKPVAKAAKPPEKAPEKAPKPVKAPPKAAKPAKLKAKAKRR